MKVVIGLAVVLTTITWGCETGEETPSPPVLSKVYVANEGSGTVSVINTENNERIANITLAVGEHHYSPHNVQAAPDGQSLWVTAPPMDHGAKHDGAAQESTMEQMDQIVIIDPHKDTIISRMDLGENLHLAHVVLDSDSQYAYVSANATGQIFQIDATTHKVHNTFELGSEAGPHGMRYCHGKVYVATMGAKGLTIIDPVSETITEVPLGGVAVQVACTPDGNYVFVSLYDLRQVARYDVATEETVFVPLPDDSQGPIQLYPNSAGTKLYVCDQGNLMGRPPSDKLYVIDTEKAEVETTITVGQGAHGVVLNEDGTMAYVTNTIEGTVSVVDTQQAKEITKIPVGDAPNGISHWHNTGAMP